MTTPDAWSKLTRDEPESKAMTEADRLIAALDLSPHPEGGWYRQTWEGPQVAGRASGTAILFLLKAGERSHWHRVDADEIWLWHAGAPLILRMAAGEAGPARAVRLGPDVLARETPQACVPAGHWQTAVPTGAFTLVSCTVSPGFRSDGFELAPAGFDIPEDPATVLALAFPGQEARFFAPMVIGATRESRDRGAALILTGVKTATSSLPSDYQDSPAPFPGALSAVLDGSGRVVGVVETVEVASMPFRAVTETWAADYGEGDRTLAWFREEIAAYYAEEAASRGEVWGDDALLVFERFRVVRRFNGNG
jgi:predicted cupin superfamily sugar epimerase/uncharacterized protein YhfF